MSCCLRWFLLNVSFARCALSPNGERYPLVGETGQRYFDGINFKPRKLPENTQTLTTMAPARFAGDRVHAVLGALL